jgi:hypothetical protein
MTSGQLHYPVRPDFLPQTRGVRRQGREKTALLHALADFIALFRNGLVRQHQTRFACPDMHHVQGWLLLGCLLVILPKLFDMAQV